MVGFTHVAWYGPRSALGAATVDSLLDAASHDSGGRWVLLGLVPRGEAHRRFSWTTVMGPGFGLRLTRTALIT